jgi:hypothetical protein
MTPRLALSSVPSAFSALSAATAATATSVDWTGIANRPTSSCSGATPFVTGIGPTGAVTCGAVPPGSAGCLDGQILKYVGTAWVCAADQTGAGGTTYTAAAPLALTGGVFSIGVATSSTDGYLSSADWQAFNAKLSAVAVASPLTGDGTVGAPLSLPAAGLASDGYLSALDWQVFNAKLSGVAVAAPFSGNGSVSSPVSMLAASDIDSGYLTSTAYAFFAGKLGAASSAWPLTGDGAGGGPLTMAGCAPGMAGKTMTWDGATWTCQDAVAVLYPYPGGGINVYAGTPGYREIGLADTGVIPGTYPVVQVDAQGRVIAGGSYSSLAAYGITDGVQLQTPGSASPQVGDVAVLGDVYATTFVGNLSGAASSVAGNSIQPRSLYMAGSPGPTPGQVPASGLANDFYWVTPVTQVTAGSGLTGGGTGTPSLAANFTASGGTNGVAVTVARGDHTHPVTNRVISIPAQAATIDPAGTIITRSSAGLRWQNNYSNAATVSLQRPADWDGGNVTFRIMFRTSGAATAGTVGFFIRPWSSSAGSAWASGGNVPLTTLSVGATGNVVYDQAIVVPPTWFGTGTWWSIGIQRDNTLTTYTGDLDVIAFSIEYGAVQ